ncbi:MAG: acyl-CoA thioesterase [Gallionellales bacterium 35-53-114]|jgi:acyl-CoA thioesterase YciA|nr:MAG: acyl-CoA thioesterase [Gallionellales bacterium 35-53-114]OYZ65288.1 MAG: acyl-CoA thioesterase [Gallionellales bacterium 24-53-125]OZB08194.1 MAG: acyl-CoA thioesterase [Gallionellales bacterium 39-52-133]HQS58120.1 acyl-CoA thioesterase [Gallionellaceae bacterium]HQS73675.1 acyl-CoA thioesterase [Gallionellaceae bacterium]
MSGQIVTLPNREPTIRVAAMPSDANYSGDMFGGWIMGQVDIAGSIPALHRAKGRVVTVSVNSFVFKEPIFMGDIVSFYAEIIKVGRTSITVDVQVYAQRDPAKPVCVKVTEAVLTYVAIGEDRKPRVLPSVE